jgi:hypothetical protein
MLHSRISYPKDESGLEKKGAKKRKGAKKKGSGSGKLTTQIGSGSRSGKKTGALLP